MKNIRNLIVSSFIVVFSQALLADLPPAEQKQLAIDTHSFFKTTDHVSLRYDHFEPSWRSSPPNHLVFLQGRGNAIEYYKNIYPSLLQRGFDVWTYDLVGQGASSRLLPDEPKKLHIDDFSVYEAHLKEFIAKVVAPKSTDRLYLMGSSTGGNIALRYAAHHPIPQLKGVVATSPLLDLGTTWLRQWVLLPVVVRAVAATPFNTAFAYGNHQDPFPAVPFAGNPYTSYEPGFKDMKTFHRDFTTYTLGGSSFGWVAAAVRSGKQVLEEAPHLKVPVLLTTGSDDPHINTAYDAAYCAAIPSCTHKIYRHARHELFKETPAIQTSFWFDFDNFIRQTSAVEPREACTTP